MSKPSTSFTAAHAYLLTSKANLDVFLAIIGEAQENPRIKFLRSGAIDWVSAIREARKVVAVSVNTYEERVFIALLVKLAMHWATCSCGALPVHADIKRRTCDGSVEDVLLESYGKSFGSSFTKAFDSLQAGERTHADKHLRDALKYRGFVNARFNDIIKEPEAASKEDEEKELRLWNELLTDLNDFVGKPPEKAKPVKKTVAKKPAKKKK